VLIVGLLFIPIGFFIIDQIMEIGETSNWLPFGLYLILIFAVIIGGFGAIFGGLSREIIETKSAPNQGVRLSIRSAIIGGLILAPIGFVFGLMVATGSPNERIISVLGGGIFFWLIAALWYGGLDVIQHYLLRFMLIMRGHTPGNYARFLDYAVDRIFLQKVGGGYRFIHRFLLEHFAEMGDDSSRTG